MTESEVMKEGLRTWLGKNEVGRKAKRTVSYTDFDGNDIDIELEINILSGVDKEQAEQYLFSTDGSGGSLAKYKRELVRMSLGLVQKEVDDLYRNKPSSVVDMIEETCLLVNSSRFAKTKKETDSLKN